MLEEVIRPRPPSDRQHRRQRQDADAGDRGLNASASGAIDPICESQDGDRQRDVTLDRCDHLSARRLAVGEQSQNPVARLDQDGKRLERLERGGQTTAMSLVVVMPLASGIRVSWGHP